MKKYLILIVLLLLIIEVKAKSFYTIIDDDASSAESITTIKNICDNKDIKIIPDRESAIKEAILTASVGDTVLIVGKGNEAYNDKGGRKRAFDERAIIRDALLLRKNDS